MQRKDIENMYNYYKNTISNIRKLENRLLKESYSFEKWLESLKNKSVTIRKMYAENEKHIKDVLDTFLKKFKSMPDGVVNEAGESKFDIADQFMTHVDFFMSEGYRDYKLVVPVLEVLIPYYRENGPVYRLFDASYFMGLAIMEQRKFDKAQGYFNMSIDVANDIEGELEDYRCFRIMCSHYYRLLCIVCLGCEDYNLISYYRNSALDLWINNVPVSFMSKKKTRAIEHIINSLPAKYFNDCMNKGIVPRKNDIRFCLNAYSDMANHFHTEYKINSKLFVVVNKFRLLTEEITHETYKNLILEKFMYEKENHSLGFDYGDMDFIALFDDEYPDEDFAVEKLFFMNPSYAYINYLLPEVLKVCDDSSVKEQVFSEIRRYYSGMPIVYGNYLIDYAIENNIINVISYTTDVDELIYILEIIYINRQVMTVIHSHMVSKIATTIAGYAIDNYPELLVGIPGVDNEKDVVKKRDYILKFVRDAGRLHDIGKIVCSDIINLQARRITDEEFKIIKKHSTRGGFLANSIKAARPFEDIVKGHHKSYDSRFGYPDNYDVKGKAIKTMVDLIKICDCIDAATDGLGRNYARAKDFKTVLSELVKGAGTFYSDKWVECIKSSDELIARLEQLTKVDREKINYEIFHHFIEPDVRFRPKDEKYIRVCRDSDLEVMVSVSGLGSDEIKELYKSCRGEGYIMLDGYGRVYGFVLMKRLFEEKQIEVRVYVDKNERRMGYGSMLIETCENCAIKEGFDELLLPYVTQAHNDKFGWRNGFVDVNEDGFMEKYI